MEQNEEFNNYVCNNIDSVGKQIHLRTCIDELIFHSKPKIKINVIDNGGLNGPFFVKISCSEETMKKLHSRIVDIKKDYWFEPDYHVK